MPELPLSVGSCEQARTTVRALPNVCILPRTLKHLSAYAYSCVYYISYTMYMTEAPRILHFSAFHLQILFIHKFIYIKNADRVLIYSVSVKPALIK